MSQLNESPHKSIVIRSLGRAGVALIPQLQKGFNLSSQVVAQKLFQAPSVLVKNLPVHIAEDVVTFLRSQGIDADTAGSGETVALGDQHHEIALHFTSFKEIKSIYKEIHEILGFDEREFGRIAKKTPSILIGNISKTTAEVIKQRLSELSVLVEVSNIQEAAYDLMIQVSLVAAPSSNLEMTKSRLRELSVDFSEQRLSSSQVLLFVKSVGYKIADDIWQHCRRNKLSCVTLNNDYQRFDLKLISLAENNPGIFDYLIESFGIPEKVARKIVDHLPVVIGKHLSLDEVHFHMARLSQLGACAQAELLATAIFQIELSGAELPSSARKIFENFFDFQKEVTDNLFEEFQAKEKIKLPGTFGYNQSLWGKAELENLGVRCHLIKCHGNSNVR